MKVAKTWMIREEAELTTVAVAVAPLVKGGAVIGLAGGLGAGKTTFLRYLGAVLGVQEPTSSPSYVLMHEYTTSSGLIIEHWDVYRCVSLPLELGEPASAHTARLIEWADAFPELRDTLTARIEFSVTDGMVRVIRLEE